MADQLTNPGAPDSVADRGQPSSGGPHSLTDLEVVAKAQGFRVERTETGWTFHKGQMIRPAGLPKKPVDLWVIIADLQRMGLKLSDRE